MPERAAAVGPRGTGVGAKGLAAESFRAYVNSAFSIPTGSETVVPFNAKDWDCSGRFNVTTNAYTPKVKGIYRLSAVVQFNASIADQIQLYMTVRKNASAEALLCSYRTSGADPFYPVWGSALVKANGETDTFDIVVFQNAGGSRALNVGRTASFFCGELVGRI